ncbi:MAG: hypothetical protein QXD05_01440 [Candidatus Pacearchaeota archaeon]
MNLKIKAPKGDYALRTFDKYGNELFYTSTRLGGLKYDKDYYICTIPDDSIQYEICDLKKLTRIRYQIKGDKNVSD